MRNRQFTSEQIAIEAEKLRATFCAKNRVNFVKDGPGSVHDRAKFANFRELLQNFGKAEEDGGKPSANVRVGGPDLVIW